MATILIIDDDADVRETLALVLEEAGHTPIMARSGAEGARIFGEARPELVLTDMIMPESDGLEAMRAIRALDPAARIIAMSGASFAGSSYYLQLAKRFGAAAVLPKPFEPDELVSTIDFCLSTPPTAKTPDTTQ
jgi:CheY-like chemotaxis protein